MRRVFVFGILVLVAIVARAGEFNEVLKIGDPAPVWKVWRQMVTPPSCPPWKSPGQAMEEGGATPPLVRESLAGPGMGDPDTLGLARNCPLL